MSAEPLVLYEKVKGALRIAAQDAKADALGFHCGMALAEARAMHPRLLAAPADPAGDATDFRRFAERLLRYAPLVGVSRTGEAALDVTGCAHLFGGEDALLDDLLDRTTRAGFAARAAIAGSVGCAHALACYGEARIVPCGGERAALSPLPVEALRIEPAAAAALRRLGLKRIGQLYDLPRAPLTQRFNAHLLARLEAALGRRGEPLTPIVPAPDHCVEARLAEPVSTAEAILDCARRLAPRLEALLEKAGVGGRRFVLTLFRVDGKLHRTEVRASRPLRDARRFMKLIETRLGDLHDEREAGFGYDQLRLGAHAAEAVEAEALCAFGGERAAEDVSALLDRLANRLGAAQVCGLRLRDSHVPEKSAALVAHDAEPAPAPEAPGALRPLKLLPAPEPIEATALLPDAPPMRFSWRRIPYVVKKASGPERILGEWWTQDEEAPARDYYRVEDAEGRRWWIYREGLWGDDAPPRWFLHGFFG